MKKQTFLLEIDDTEGHGWQGRLEWVEGRRRQDFQSVAGLLRLIDSVVAKEPENDFNRDRN